MRNPFTIACLAAALVVSASSGAPGAHSAEYTAVQRRLAQGWNTWDTHSVLTQVLLPQGFAIRLGLQHNSSLNADAFLDHALIGQQEKDAPVVSPGAHTWDGSYTELRLSWRGHNLQVQSAHDGEDLVMLVSPFPGSARLPATVIVSAGVLWNREGGATRQDGHLAFQQGNQIVPVFCTAPASAADVPVASPYLSARLDQPVGVSTGHPRTRAEIEAVMQKMRPTATDVPAAIETVLGWDTIYEPSQRRVISPVSRIWNLNWGGYVLFEWDTYFAAALAATGNRDLAYANAVEITREATDAGFVPNYARAGGWKSVDRSEPPVGAVTILRLYRRFGDRWLLRDTFATLQRWNQWWAEHRDVNGYLVWASDRDAQPRNPDDGTVGTKQGAMYESGLDNSPMFDDAPFHAETQRLNQADVGLMGLYVADTKALAEIATILGRGEDAAELRARAARYTQALQTLWSEPTGIFLNRNLDTGAFNPRLSPTNFYPLLAHVATPIQARRMVESHLLNPAEFWGEWVIPSIARSDAAFHDQEYWRGRIWGPMNYLVYLGLRNYDFPDVRQQLANRSLALFEKEWRTTGHVHENYNAITGEGDDVPSSDRFYHWGALLGLISWEESHPYDNRPQAP